MVSLFQQNIMCWFIVFIYKSNRLFLESFPYFLNFVFLYLISTFIPFALFQHVSHLPCPNMCPIYHVPTLVPLTLSKTCSIYCASIFVLSILPKIVSLLHYFTPDPSTLFYTLSQHLTLLPCPNTSPFYLVQHLTHLPCPNTSPFYLVQHLTLLPGPNTSPFYLVPTLHPSTLSNTWPLYSVQHLTLLPCPNTRPVYLVQHRTLLPCPTSDPSTLPKIWPF